MLIPRNLKTDILESLRYSHVTLINGARQTGKSTLAKRLFDDSQHPQYITFDDIAALAFARSAPKNFIQSLQEQTIIDEVQLAPELFRSIKESVDADGKPGRFLLTGSANVLTLPRLSDSLAGRMEIHTLWPLSQGELRGRQEAFVDLLFQHEKFPVVKPITLPELLKVVVTGGYPAILKRETERARRNWFTGYIKAILQRDIRELSNIEGIIQLPNLLALIATRSGGLLNLSDLSRSLAVPYMTLKLYLSLLEAVFLIVPLPAWFNNLGKRLVKSPKLFINDTGLLCHLLGQNAKALENNRTLLGSVYENFVFMELTKQVEWSETRPRLFHFRTLESGHEVDFVLEAPDGRIIGIECKASSTLSDDCFKGMHTLMEQAGQKFHRGVVLYTGSYVLQAADNLIAIPVSALWETTLETPLKN